MCKEKTICDACKFGDKGCINVPYSIKCGKERRLYKYKLMEFTREDEIRIMYEIEEKKQEEINKANVLINELGLRLREECDTTSDTTEDKPIYPPKHRRVELYENKDFVLERRDDVYYLSFYDENGEFIREAKIKLDTDSIWFCQDNM